LNFSFKAKRLKYFTTTSLACVHFAQWSTNITSPRYNFISSLEGGVACLDAQPQYKMFTSHFISFRTVLKTKTRLDLARGHYRYALMELSLDLRINEKPLREREKKKGMERHSKKRSKNGQTASVV
jgi:hypothetical protein